MNATKKISKMRLLSMLLALMMLLTLLPTTAFAANEVSVSNQTAAVGSDINIPWPADADEFELYEKGGTSPVSGGYTTGYPSGMYIPAQSSATTKTYYFRVHFPGEWINSNEFTVTWTNTSTPLVFEDKEAYDIPAGTQGETYTATTALTATGGAGSYEFSIDPAVPGLSINSENKLVYTRPTVQGAATATIIVTDDDATTSNITIDIGAVSAAGGGTTTTTELTTVDVSGITLPVVGETPDYDVTLPKGANYHLATAEELRNLGWTDLDIQGLTNGMRWETASYSLLSSSDRFEAGKEYYFTVALLPNSGYTFSDNPNATLNGSTDTLRSTYIDRGALLVFSTDLKATGAGGGTTTTYEVWVNGIQVTSDNKDDILNDGSTAFYDPNSQTLTLNGYNGGAIRANHALTVTLAAGSENTVTNPASNEVYCISANNNNLTINGSGYLKVIQYRYNCSAITTDTYGGNLIINMAGNLDVTNYSWHGLYAFGSVTISGSGDVSIYNEGTGTGIVSGTDDIILSGSGKLTVDAQNAACAVRLKTSGKALLLNGTGAPLSFSAGTYKAIVNQADKTNPVRGTNLAYYNKVTGAPNTASVVYDHGTTTPTEIKAANITVTAPKTGETPSSATTTDTAYTIASTSWEPTDDPFKADTAYSVVINLKAAGADKFTENTKFYINGEEATLVSPNPITGNVDQVRVSYTFPKTEAAVTPHTHAGTLVPRVEPTFTTTGLEKHYKCSCGSLFRDLTCNVPTDLTELVIPMLPYKIIEGNGGVYTKGSGKTLTFKANGPEADCTGVKIDGALIDAANYTKVSGSTIITLKNNYLETLSDGNHHSIIVAYGTREEATANFKVLSSQGGNTGGSGQTTFPKTGDNSNMLLWLALMFVSCGGIVTTFVVKRKSVRSK